MRNLLFYILLAIIFLSCAKSSDPDPELPDPKNFTADIGNVQWSSRKYHAVYNPKWGILMIEAEGDSLYYMLMMGIHIDPVNPARTYPMESNGNNVAKLLTNLEQYTSDHNVADAGGNFVITKFDTVAKLLSANLAFRAYSSHRDEKVQLENGKLTDIPLEIDNTPFDSNYVTGKIKGEVATSWLSKDINAWLFCYPATDTLFDFTFSSVLGYSPKNRSLTLRIPGRTIAGTYPIYPDKLPWATCPSTYILGKYNINNIDNVYQAVSGTLKITEVDWPSRKLYGEYNLTVRDTLRNETVEITEGVIHLDKWFLVD